MGLFHDLLFGASPKGENELQEPTKDDELERRAEELERRSGAPLNLEDANEPQKASDPYRDSAGNKIYPDVEIVRVKSDLSSDSKHLEIWAFVKNQSIFDVEVTRINCLGQSASGCFLKVGDSRELRIFSGNTPTSEAYHDANVQFKVIGSGDYFQANHYVQYHYEQTEHGNFYIPDEFKFTRPVRDI